MNLTRRVYKVAEAITAARQANEAYKTSLMRALDRQKTELMRACSSTGTAELTPLYQILWTLAMIHSQPHKLTYYTDELTRNLEKVIAVNRELVDVDLSAIEATRTDASRGLTRYCGYCGYYVALAADDHCADCGGVTFDNQMDYEQWWRDHAEGQVQACLIHEAEAAYEAREAERLRDAEYEDRIYRETHETEQAEWDRRARCEANEADEFNFWLAAEDHE